MCSSLFRIWFISTLLFWFCNVSAQPENSESLSPEIDSISVSLTQILEVSGDLPFRGASHEYYALFPGTIVQDYRGEPHLHIRGSRHDEIGYYFNGVDVRSQFTGLNLIRFIPEALTGIELNTSPGSGQSGAAAFVGHQLRRGGEQLRFNLRAETDRFTGDYNSRFDTFSYGYQNYLFTTEGKILKDNIRFFAAGEAGFFDDHYRKFWPGFTLDGKETPLEITRADFTLEELTGSNILEVRPGNIQNASSERYTINSIITADFSPLKIDFIAAHNFQKLEINETPILDMFTQQRVPEERRQASMFSLQADYDFGKGLFAHLQADAIRASAKQTDPLLGDNFLLYTDSLALAKKGVTFIDIFSLWINDFPFTPPGDVLARYNKMEESNWQLSGNVSKKIGVNKLTLGGALKRGTYRGYDIGSINSYVQSYKSHSDYLANSWSEIMFAGYVQAIGYDIAGNEINETGDFTERARHPVEYSAFIENTFGVSDLQIDIGLRYDAFGTDALTFSNLLLATSAYYNAYQDKPLPGLERAPTHSRLSPRLSTIYKPYKNLWVHFNYGKYLQQPRLQDVYASAGFLQRLLSGSFFITDLRAFDAKPVQSTQSSAGIAWRIKPELLMNLNVYRRFSETYLESVMVETESSFFFDYLKLDNTGEAVAKGVEFGLKYHKQNTFMMVNYTLSDVSGYGTYPTSNISDVAPYVNTSHFSKSKGIAPLEYNQTHRANVFYSYRFDRNINPVLRNTGLSLLFRFNSGHNFNLYDGGSGDVNYGSLLSDFDPRSRNNLIARITTPWFYTFDLKLDRQFRILGSPVALFVYVQNLFNRKNVQHVYWRSGDSENDGLFDITPGFRELLEESRNEGYFVLYDLINTQHRQHYAVRQGGDLYGRPREIRFGLQVAFGD